MDDKERVTINLEALNKQGKRLIDYPPSVAFDICARNAYYYRRALDEYICQNTNLDEYYSIANIKPGFVVRGDKLTFYREDDEQVSIPDGVRIIASGAFVNKEVETLVIPYTVVKIEENAFVNCPYLRKVSFGTNRKELLSNNLPFGDLTSQIALFSFPDTLNVVDITGYKKSIWFEQNDRDFVICGSTLLYYQGFEEHVILPDHIKHIAVKSFKGRSYIKKVTLSDEIETIQMQAFEGCINLEIVDNWKNTIKLGTNVFKGADNVSFVIGFSHDYNSYKELEDQGFGGAETIIQDRYGLSCRNMQERKWLEMLDEHLEEICHLYKWGLERADEAYDVIKRIPNLPDFYTVKNGNSFTGYTVYYNNFFDDVFERIFDGAYVPFDSKLVYDFNEKFHMEHKDEHLLFFYYELSLTELVNQYRRDKATIESGLQVDLQNSLRNIRGLEFGIITNSALNLTAYEFWDTAKRSKQKCDAQESYINNRVSSLQMLESNYRRICREIINNTLRAELRKEVLEQMGIGFYYLFKNKYGKNISIDPIDPEKKFFKAIEEASKSRRFKRVLQIEERENKIRKKREDEKKLKKEMEKSTRRKEVQRKLDDIEKQIDIKENELDQIKHAVWGDRAKKKAKLKAELKILSDTKSQLKIDLFNIH